MSVADSPRRTGHQLVPEALVVPVALIATVSLLALAVGLYSLSVHRDRTIDAVVAEAELVAADLLEATEELRGDDAEALLARAVLATEHVRAASVWRGLGDVVTVGSPTTDVTPQRVEAAAGRSTALTSEVADGDAVRVTLAFARLDGEPVALEVEAPLAPPTIGWGGLATVWAVVTIAIVAATFVLERSRRDRVLTLEETVQALYAHDVEVTRQQQDLLRTKSDFVATISNELRGPLSVIKGIADVLARSDGRISAQQRQGLVDALRLNADRLDLLMRDVIDVDRLTARTISVARADVRLDTALDAALEGVATDEHELVRDVEGVVAHVTPGHLERILRQLVHNAVTHAPAGTTVTVRATREDDAVHLVVADQGPGVAPEDRQKVFEPLRKVGGAATDGGLGLGLALVKRFTELHGGRVWVEEALGGGAAFHVRLPDDGEPTRVDPWQLPAQVSDGAVQAGTP